MALINIENFIIKCTSNINNENAVTSLLNEILISNPDAKKKHLKTDGFIRVPIGDDPRCKHANTDKIRTSSFFQTLKKFQNGDIDYTKLEYITIEFRGTKNKECYLYANLLMEFIDYIVPFINKRDDNNINIENIIYADHLKKKNTNPTFHVLCTSNTTYEFYGLWMRYLDVLKTDFPDMITYNE